MRSTAPTVYPDSKPGSQGYYRCTFFFFFFAHQCDLNVPRRLFPALHRCLVGVLSVQKNTREDTAQASFTWPGLSIIKTNNISSIIKATLRSVGMEVHVCALFDHMCVVYPPLQ